MSNPNHNCILVDKKTKTTATWNGIRLVAVETDGECTGCFFNDMKSTKKVLNMSCSRTCHTAYTGLKSSIRWRKENV